MADTWTQYFGGTDEQIEADRRRRQAEYDAIRANKIDQALKRLGDAPVSGALLGLPTNREYDPREIRAAMVDETIHPSVRTDFGDDIRSTVNKAGSAAYSAGKAAYPVYSAVFETGMRPRDTLIRATQEYNKGNEWEAAKLAARAPLSMVYWPAAAGTPGSPDDWREDARQRGIPEGNILAIDLLTDPETWLPIPIPVAAAGKAARYAKPAVSAMRYGRGVPTHLVDEAGEVIRRLRNTPVGAR